MKTLTLAALAATLFAAPALAQSPGTGSQSHVVSYADLDLSSAKGRAKLDRRIRSAVQDVCGTAYSFDVKGKNDVRRCRTELMERLSSHRDIAVASANRPAPTILASQR